MNYFDTRLPEGAAYNVVMCIVVVQLFVCVQKDEIS